MRVLPTDRSAGRGVTVLARAPGFGAWWHDAQTWDGDLVMQIGDHMFTESGYYLFKIVP
jgi:hypothetical protein